MRRTERLARTYIRYKTTPAFALFWVVVGTLAWAVLLYASVFFGRQLSKGFGL